MTSRLCYGFSFFFSIRRRHTRCALVTGVQTWALPILGARSAQNVAKMAERLKADPHPMQFMGALKAVRDVVHARPETYIVNEGANALDIARNVIDKLGRASCRERVWKYV